MQAHSAFKHKVYNVPFDETKTAMRYINMPIQLVVLEQCNASDRCLH